jgi:hypothetical protein
MKSQAHILDKIIKDIEQKLDNTSYSPEKTNT